tara:strand:+ start:1658 stop:1864 length:207 start_codon:yes stop_codon:yes gene_type:complete
MKDCRKTRSPLLQKTEQTIKPAGATEYPGPQASCPLQRSADHYGIMTPADDIVSQLLGGRQEQPSHQG